MIAPERIYCRIDADLTDTGEFLGTCWRDDDGLSIPYLRADTITARLADAEAMAEAAERFRLFLSDHPSPAVTYLVTSVGNDAWADFCAALEKWRAGK